MRELFHGDGHGHDLAMAGDPGLFLPSRSGARPAAAGADEMRSACPRPVVEAFQGRHAHAPGLEEHAVGGGAVLAKAAQARVGSLVTSTRKPARLSPSRNMSCIFGFDFDDHHRSLRLVGLAVWLSAARPRLAQRPAPWPLAAARRPSAGRPASPRRLVAAVPDPASSPC